MVIETSRCAHVLRYLSCCRSRTSAPESGKRSVTAVMSGVPVIRNARPNARRRTAASRHSGSGCSHAPRPGSVPAASTVTAPASFPGPSPPSTATTRSNSTASSRFRHPMQVRTGPPGGTTVFFCIRADVSRWITAESTVTAAPKRKSVPKAGGRGASALAHGAVRGARTGLGPTRRTGGRVLRRVVVAADVDTPTGQPGCQAGVLPFLADRQ